MKFPFLVHTAETYLNVKRKTNLNYFKLIPLILLFGITACDNIPDGVVEHQVADFKIVSLNAPQTFKYDPADSLISVSIKIENYEVIETVWITVKSIDGGINVVSQKELLDDGNILVSGDQLKGDGIFSSRFPISKKIPNGDYNIEYFVKDKVKPSPNSTVRVGSHIFSYSNNFENQPPVVSDLSIQSSVNRGVSFDFSIKAEDPNGPIDILHVYFRLFRPDGTKVDPQNGYDYFIMVDNGDSILGDQIANDGIYSFRNSFGTTTQTGNWRFEFQAKDRSGALSNQINHEMTVN